MKRMYQGALAAVLSIALLGCAAETDGGGDAVMSGDAATSESGETTGAATGSTAGANGSSVAEPDFPAGQTAAPAQTTRIVPAGTTLTFTLSSVIDTETSTAGEEFEAVLSSPVAVDGRTVLPANSVATGQVVSVQRPGRVQGVARIELDMIRIEIDGRTYELETAPFVAEATTERGEDAARIGAGAGIGAVIGGVIGGGEGAAIGAAIGGGTGTAVVLNDRGDEIEILPETEINFLLDEPLRVTER